MKIILFYAITFLLLNGYTSTKEEYLREAFCSKLTKTEILDLFDSKKIGLKELENAIGTKNFTYFLMALKPEQLNDPKLDFKYKTLNAIERARKLGALMEAEGAFLSFEKLQQTIVYKNLSETQKLGSAQIDNNIYKARLIFIEDKKTGKILSLAIAKKNSDDLTKGFNVFMDNNVAQGKKVEPRTFITLQQGKDGKTVLSLDNQKMTFEQLSKQLMKLKKETVIIIRAEREVPFKGVNKILEIIKESGITKVRIQAELE